MTDERRIVDNIRASSNPTELKITDMRFCNLKGVPFDSTIIRIDTNQGIYGLGEVRDGGSYRYAMFLKSRILGMNPCSVEMVFRRIKQFGFHGRQVSGHRIGVKPRGAESVQQSLCTTTG